MLADTIYSTSSHPHLVRQINHNTSLQLLLIHLLKHTRQLIQLLNPIMRLHNAPGRKLHRLNRLLPGPDRGADNLQRLTNHDSSIRASNGLHIALGDADAHHAAAKAE